MKTIIAATNNAGKIREIREILSAFGYAVQSLREAGIQADPEENGETFAENAAIKARAVRALTVCPVIADDSGLAVDALDGAPGVHSHRFAGEHATDADRNQKLLALLGDLPAEERTARFICALCYIDKDGNETIFNGKCEGTIGFAPVGENGFGYDPLFLIPEGRSLAQLSDAEKNAISHRGNALRQFQNAAAAGMIQI